MSVKKCIHTLRLSNSDRLILICINYLKFLCVKEKVSLKNEKINVAGVRSNNMAETDLKNEMKQCNK